MKNVHLLPTENYKQDYTTMRGEVIEVVRLGQLIINKKTSELSVNKNPQWAASCDTDILVPHHIYITSDEEIKHEDWYIYIKDSLLRQYNKDSNPSAASASYNKKIILTTDSDLIKDGVQAIDDEFLEWFVKNPSCEFVDVKLNSFGECHGNDCSCFDIADQKVCVFHYPDYKMIIPQEESKQEYVKCTFCEGTGQIVSSTTISGFKTCDCIIMPQEEPKLTNNCPKCGMDLVEREYSKPICTRIDCGGIILSNETLKEFAAKNQEETKTVFEQLEVGKDFEQEVFELGEETLFQPIEPPIGDFIFANANAIQLEDGYYYHYSEVCKLLKLQAERMYSKEAVEEMFATLKRNSVDNIATVHNIDLFIESWTREFKKA